MFRQKNETPWQNTTLPEPDDFPEASSAPGLRSLDAALRCPICKEFFNGPVSLRCGHSFCSQCIREALSVKQECPTCRKGQENEGHIRPNPALEEAVTSWEGARTSILLYIEKANKPDPTPDSSRKRKRKNSDSDIEIISSTRDESSSKTQERPMCPMCNTPATIEIINQHLDNGCPTKDTKNTKDAWSSLFMTGKKSTRGKGKTKSSMSDAEEDTPLPKVSYDTLKDKQIKDLLAEQGLLPAGDRNNWIKQHQRWVIIFNANLDKAPKHRKATPRLKQELSQWLEKQQSKSKPVVEDATVHQRKFHKEFACLTEAARPKKQTLSRSQSPQHRNPLVAMPVSPQGPPLLTVEEEGT